MNWKWTVGIIGGYLALSWLRKRGAVTINKTDAAGAVLDQAANQGDKIAAVAGQVKDVVAEKIGGTPGTVAPAGQSAGPTTDEQVLGTIF